MLREMQQYIDNVSCLWKEQPEEDVLRYSEYLMSQFSTNSQVTAFISGMIRMAIVSEDTIYKQIATACFRSAKKQNIFPLDLLPVKLPPEDGGSSLQISIEKASEVSSKQQEQEKTVGLLHGHYRLLTPGNLANIALTNTECDVLLLGMERGSRTAKYKGVDPVYSDWERAVMVLASGLSDYLVWISRLDYSNDGYRRMVEDICPNIYFGNAGDPVSLREEMQFRANTIGAEYHEIKRIKSFSSTDFKEGNVIVPVL